MKKNKKICYREITANIEVKKVDNITKEETIMKQEEEKLPTEPIEQDAAYVSVKAGSTISLPNYCSGRIDVMLNMPCYPSEIDNVYDKVKDWVDQKVGEEVSELRKLSEK